MAKQMEQSNRIPIAVANALAIETERLRKAAHAVPVEGAATVGALA